MTFYAHLRDGVAVPEGPVDLPEGTRVRLEPVPDAPEASGTPPGRRRGGWWKGRVEIAPDFDVLPAEIAEAFGMDAT